MQQQQFMSHIYATNCDQCACALNAAAHDDNNELLENNNKSHRLPERNRKCVSGVCKHYAKVEQKHM